MSTCFWGRSRRDRKSTRLNSSHEWISYAVFCLKKKKTHARILQLTKNKKVDYDGMKHSHDHRLGLGFDHSRLDYLRQSAHRQLFFFFNDTATTEIYTLSLHDALPI